MKNKEDIQNLLIYLEVDIYNRLKKIDDILCQNFSKINTTVIIVESRYSHYDKKFIFEVRKPIGDLIVSYNAPLFDVHCKMVGNDLSVTTEIKNGKPYIFNVCDIRKILNSDEVKPKLLEIKKLGKVKKFYTNRLMMVEGIEKFNQYDIKAGDIYVHKKHNQNIIEIVKITKSTISYLNQGLETVIHRVPKVKFLSYAALIRDFYKMDIKRMRIKKIENLMS